MYSRNPTLKSGGQGHAKNDPTVPLFDDFRIVRTWDRSLPKAAVTPVSFAAFIVTGEASGFRLRDAKLTRVGPPISQGAVTVDLACRSGGERN